MMETKEILAFCLKKGLLLDQEVLNYFSEEGDVEGVKIIIEKVSNHTRQKVITKEVFKKNREKMEEIFQVLPAERKKILENLKIKLGLSIEISKEVSSEVEKVVAPERKEESLVKVIAMESPPSKKIVVKDFVTHFRNRFKRMGEILQNRAELTNLVSIGKIGGDRQKFSIIGLISDKRVTKNKNILLEVEDLSGKMKVLINKDKPELYEVAEDILPDAILGFKGSGNKEILFTNEVIFPEAAIPLRKKAKVEEYALFIGDLHYGSKLFLKDNFEDFLNYINGNVPNTPEVKKIKYLFILGDVVSGIGNYPSQEKDLKIKDLEQQFIDVAEMIGRIPKNIKIIISPGNHDSMRIMEPQPLFNEKYAWPLYQLDNVILVGNPAQVNIAAREGFGGFDVLTYHGFSFGYYVGNVGSLIKEKAQHAPEKIAKYLLKLRHLAPTHSSTQYFPSEKDALLIENVPDILAVAHFHKSAVSYHNNILIISVSSWESMTPYEVKLGAQPDFCKVPMLNLKTREVKILDFEKKKNVKQTD
jgi:DNA polymerase II small subunit